MTTTQQKYPDPENRKEISLFLERLNQELYVKGERKGADKFIKWLSTSDFFVAPLVLPNTTPDSVSETGIASYRPGGFVQRGLAFYLTKLVAEQFDTIRPALLEKGVKEDSMLLCCLTYALDCTARFKLNEQTGMYEDSKDNLVLPPGIRRSQHILTRYFELSTDELYAIAMTFPGFEAGVKTLPLGKQVWYGKFCKEKPLCVASTQMNECAVMRLAEKLASHNK